MSFGLGFLGLGFRFVRSFEQSFDGGRLAAGVSLRAAARHGILPCLAISRLASPSLAQNASREGSPPRYPCRRPARGIGGVPLRRESFAQYPCRRPARGFGRVPVGVA